MLGINAGVLAGPGAVVALSALLLLGPADSVSAEGMGLQYQGTLGRDQGSGRLAFFLEGHRLFGDLTETFQEDFRLLAEDTQSLVAVPVYHHGPSRQGPPKRTARRREPGAEKIPGRCTGPPAPCAAAPSTFSGAPLLDLGIYRRLETTRRQGPTGSHHLAP